MHICSIFRFNRRLLHHHLLRSTRSASTVSFSVRCGKRFIPKIVLIINTFNYFHFQKSKIFYFFKSLQKNNNYSNNTTDAILFLRNWNTDFACRRHDTLITPHKRNEVECSLGEERSYRQLRHPDRKIEPDGGYAAEERAVCFL